MGLGVVWGWLTLLVLVPLAAVVLKSTDGGLHGFWTAATSPASLSSLELTVGASLAVTAVNAVLGTVIAWVIVRAPFPGSWLLDLVIDLPFALPTVVAGLTLIALYGPGGPTHVNVAYTRWGVLLALAFVTLPFVVRAVQPVLRELGPEVEEAAHSLGAGPWTTFRTVVLPDLVPAILAGCALSFARAIGEFGSVVLISGNIPLKTEVGAVHVFGLLESDDPVGAAAVSVVLLAVAVLVLALLGLLGRRLVGGHARGGTT